MSEEKKVRHRFSERIAFIAPWADDDRTQQHFLHQVNVNNIVAKYRKTGIVEHVKRAQARYGDFSELAEFATNMDKVAKAQQGFEALPAAIRNEFKNSIPGFFEYIQDPKNREQCEKWGIFNKKPDAPAEPVPAGSKKDGSIKKSPKISDPLPEEG